MTTAAEVDLVRIFPDRDWLGDEGTSQVEHVLERGEVLGVEAQGALDIARRVVGPCWPGRRRHGGPHI